MKPYVIALLILAACATPGARPHDMSAKQHEAEATRHQQLNTEHAARFEPNAAPPTAAYCVAGSAQYLWRYSGCWTSVVNPTRRHLDEAAAHRKHAADHRAASIALREAEASACIGIAEGDRDQSPFGHSEDIISVTGLRARPPLGKHRPDEIVGAAIAFRAVEGLTVESLQRMVDCHLARNAALGHPLEEMPTCPLVPKGVTARVHTTANALVVEVIGDDPRAAQEILERAQKLRSSLPPISAQGGTP